MTVKRIILASVAALTIGTSFGALDARAQYYGGDEYRPQRRYEERYERRRDYDEDRYERRPRGGYGGGRGGSICVTARGNCSTRPAPFNSPCGCEVPGFGFKRGAIGG